MIGLIVVATGRYINFVERLATDVRQHFLVNKGVKLFVLTDGVAPKGAVTVSWPRFGWPQDTIFRYHGIVAHAGVFSECSHLFHLDADMRVLSTVGGEILSDRVAVHHPGFRYKRGTYENRQESQAYVAPHEGHVYYAGGFNGGSRSEFLKTARAVVQMADEDARQGIVAIWHDESYLNRYYIDKPPTLTLSHEYCFPEGAKLPGTPRIVALNKNHVAMRA